MTSSGRLGPPASSACGSRAAAIYRDGDGRVVVVPEHGTIKRGTLASILRQAGLNTAEFLKLLD